MTTKEEIIEQLKERLLNPAISPETFDEILRKIESIKGLDL